MTTMRLSILSAIALGLAACAETAPQPILYLRPSRQVTLEMMPTRVAQRPLVAEDGVGEVAP